MQVHRGFTLLEIMVVISIMAIILASVTFVGRDSRWLQLEDEAQSIADLITNAQDHSVLSQREFGLFFYQSGWVWVDNLPVIDDETGEVELDAEGNEIKAWQVIENDPQLANYQLDGDLLMSLSIADSEIELVEQIDETDDVNADVGLRSFSAGEIFVDSFNSSEQLQQGLIPHLIFYISGEISDAYQIVISENPKQVDVAYSYQVVSDGFNPAQVNAFDAVDGF